MPGKGKGGKGKGKGKGCFKYDWTVELENPENFIFVNMYGNLEAPHLDEVYYFDIEIEADALTGGEIKDKYESCSVPCYNQTLIDEGYFTFDWDGDVTPEDDIKKIVVEIGDLKAEYDGDELPLEDGDVRCDFTWQEGDTEIGVECLPP